MKVSRECKYFEGDKPCIFHKQEGAICKCKHYQPIDYKILIIQLGGIGDVIRTTPILSKLKQEYPNSNITWITNYPEILPKLVDNALEFNEHSILKLQTEKFNLLLNFDKNTYACALSSAIKAERKKGFTLVEGKCAPIDEDAIFKFEIGLNDELNLKCKKSYPEQIFNICGYKFKGEKYVFDPQINKDKKLIGLNTGCGERWPTRLWSESKWIELAKSLKKRDYEVILLGGESEHQRNLRIAKLSNVIYLGYYSIRVFSVLVSLCDLIVTVPTMALHLAIALEKKVVLLNNVFNKREFELYGLGEIIEPNFDCTGCYKENCEKKCMDTIEVKEVIAAIKKMIEE